MFGRQQLTILLKHIAIREQLHVMHAMYRRQMYIHVLVHVHVQGIHVHVHADVYVHAICISCIVCSYKQNVLISFSSPEPVEVDYLSFSTGFGAKGDWLFNENTGVLRQ